MLTGCQQDQSLLDLPDELILQIFCDLPLLDILSVRKTCIRLCALTRDRQQWSQILQEESRTLPLPAHLQDPSSVSLLSYHELEDIVRELRAVNRVWLVPRTGYFIPAHRESCAIDPDFKNDDGARSIFLIDVFFDRWLLCIYHEKTVEIWDLQSAKEEPDKPVLCISHKIRSAGSFTSAIPQLDEKSNVLTVAVSCHDQCHVMQAQLENRGVPCSTDEMRDVNFRTIAIIPFASPIFSIRAVDPTQCLLLLGLPSSFTLLNWETGRRTVVNMVSEAEEELWNGVVGAVFLTQRHILVIKAHSLEVCTLLDSPQRNMLETSAASRSKPRGKPRSSKGKRKKSGWGMGMHKSQGSSTSGSDGEEGLPPILAAQISAAVYTHFFPSTTFRGVSFSRPIHEMLSQSDHRPDSDYSDSTIDRVSLSFLGYDVLRGLFHYRVAVEIPVASDSHIQHKTQPPLEVDVRILAAHNMAIPVAPGTSGAEVASSRSGFSRGSRGFVSACAIGPMGRRGVWVERRRGAIRRIIYGFTAPHSPPGAVASAEHGGSKLDERGAGFQPGTPVAATNPETEAETEAEAEPAHASGSDATPYVIEGKEIYEVNSYDLRDDITHVAFSENIGVVALGTRKGDIRVLGRSE